MSVDPYKTGVASKIKFVKKREVVARVVTVLEGTIDNRGIELIKPASRCVRKGEIFEFMTTTEKVKPGDIVNVVSYLGFAEVEVGGVIRIGDVVLVKGKKLGRVVGFDETHFPNHQNIVLSPINIKSGFNYAFELEEEIILKAE
jgi:hypothetical protein